MDDAWRQRWETALRETEEERPELVERGAKLRAAADEPTLSGRLRRAVHGSTLPLPAILEQLDASPEEFSAFLAGERSLSSATMDRLAMILGYELVPTGTASQTE